MSTRKEGSNNLGISGKSLYKSSGVRISPSMAEKMYKIALTRQSGRIMFNPKKEKNEQHPTCWCLRGTPNAKDSMAVKGVIGKNARLHGAITCKSVWACPTCSAKICATRQVEVAAAMKAHIAAGGYVFLMTRTFPHEMDMPLADLLTKEGKARTLFRNSRRWRDGKNARTGYICSLEVTSGERNGWHPHTHELVFATPEAFGETTCDDKGRLSSRLIDELKEAWYMALRKVGLCEQNQMSDVLAHGLDVRGGQYAAEYVAKFGRDQKWGLSRELTMHAAKVGSDAKGSHPFQLLAWAEKGDIDSAVKFREYVEAFNGKRMLSWSKGLKKLLLNEDDMTDEEAADKDLPEEVTFGRIDSDSLSVLQSRNLLPNFLGFVAELCIDVDQAQTEIDEYIAWAKTVPRVGRGDVKVKMWSKGFMYVDRERANA